MNSNYKKYTILSLVAFLVILCAGAYSAYVMTESLFYIFMFTTIASAVAGGFIFGNCKVKPKNTGVQIILLAAVTIVYLSIIIGFLWTHPLLEIADSKIAALTVAGFGLLTYIIVSSFSFISIYTDKIAGIILPNAK
ncbi:hypothetical protein [Methanimicrococcus stummii]|nr:hypothetical protein [Methanimicrococcus sp. Es2]